MYKGMYIRELILSNYVAESNNSNWLLNVSGMQAFINCVQFLLIDSATVYAHQDQLATIVTMMSAISSYKITIIPVYQTSALAAHTIQTNSLCLDHLNYKYTQLKPLHKEDWRLLHAFLKRETTSTIYKYLITESNKLMIDLQTETMVPCIVCATYVLLCIKELYYTISTVCVL